MNTYTVDLTYSKTTRQPVYSLDIQAESKSQAIARAKLAAQQDGWKGEPVKVRAIAVRAE